MRAYCREVGLDFRDSMINWEPLSQADFQRIFCVNASSGPEWFEQVLKTSRLNRCPKRPPAIIGSDVSHEVRVVAERGIEENMKYYNELYAARLTA